MGKTTPKHMTDSEVLRAEQSLLASKVRNILIRECMRIGDDGDVETAGHLAKAVRALTYDQILRMRRAILGA
ncbi:hypothetical protein LB565_04260 [Mesorhizobium sp. CA14]|uniref:hypothetical protein n=1 Tax=Mesorhizobium sp. CA14 TaxID=2876642 RepID=UPI001CCE20CB|nr:hypothetical protein [Mesorhizobium sp. CA14]MBZ9847201.1 hypothetical protein [Mesorhizobium sp. CA14]